MTLVVSPHLTAAATSGRNEITDMLATTSTEFETSKSSTNSSEPVGVVGVPTRDSRTYTITASPPHLQYLNAHGPTKLHLVLDVRMAEIGQRLGMEALCNQAAYKLANRCHEMDFGSIQQHLAFRAALHEADGLAEDNRLFHGILAFAQKNYAKLSTKVTVADCLRDAPRLMGKIIDHEFNKHVLLVDGSTNREIDTRMEFRCPHCHDRFHAELVGVATWFPCRLCGFAAADTGYWKEHYSLP